MVAMTADYRVFSRQGTKPFHCVRDGKSAIRWIRKNANRLGIDPDRIVSGGGSAGGHVAASTGTLPKHEEPGEDIKVSSVPNAMILYNPVLITAMAKGLKTFGGAQADKLKARLGVEDPKTISPFHNIRKGLPPSLILHGTADTTVPYSNAKAYSEKAAKMDLRVELEGYENMPHGFFNLGRYDNQMFLKTVTRMHQFLKSIKYLKGVPKVKEHLNSLSK